MFLSELQHKDIINSNDGKVLGHIIDAEINLEGKILYLIIESKKSLKRIISSSSEIKLSFTDIIKIGEDVILVNI
ncbi:MAG: YlmC/YmxH family sporulation protein [Bacilli bacterium]|nr:YlmC/YmxH family sporulation protein [Bacilli bacterium]